MPEILGDIPLLANGVVGLGFAILLLFTFTRPNRVVSVLLLCALFGFVACVLLLAVCSVCSALTLSPLLVAAG
jgi:hypothetical protein